MMITSILKKLVSPYLSPYTITFRAWNGHPSQPLGLYHNCQVIATCKIVFIGIKVIDHPLDYNIILVRSYTYSMSVVHLQFIIRCAFPSIEILSPSIS